MCYGAILNCTILLYINLRTRLYGTLLNSSHKIEFKLLYKCQPDSGAEILWLESYTVQVVDPLGIIKPSIHFFKPRN